MVCLGFRGLSALSVIPAAAACWKTPYTQMVVLRVIPLISVPHVLQACPHHVADVIARVDPTMQQLMWPGTPYENEGL